jgi:hypothetical protein
MLICIAPPETVVLDEVKILAVDEEETHPSWLGDSELLKESDRGLFEPLLKCNQSLDSFH